MQGRNEGVESLCVPAGQRRGVGNLLSHVGEKTEGWQSTCAGRDEGVGAHGGVPMKHTGERRGRQ